MLPFDVFKGHFFKRLILRIKNSRLMSRFVINIAYLIMRTLFATYRFEFEFDNSVTQPFKENIGVFYFWHQQIIASLFFFFKMDSIKNCIVSSSKDGKIGGGIIEKLGFNVIYGSTFKNPIQVTRQALKALQDGQQLCIVGDGSRGPAHILMQGVPFLAKTANVPLFFVDCASSWNLTFKKSWDNFQVPLPFSKIKVKITRTG